MHASRRGPPKWKEQKDKCIAAKSSYRKAPTVDKKKRSKDENRRQRGGQAQAKELRRHITFMASTNPPREELIQRVKNRIEANHEDARRRHGDISKEAETVKKITTRKFDDVSKTDKTDNASLDRRNFHQALRDQAREQSRTVNALRNNPNNEKGKDHMNKYGGQHGPYEHKEFKAAGTNSHLETEDLAREVKRDQGEQVGRSSYRAMSTSSKRARGRHEHDAIHRLLLQP